MVDFLKIDLDDYEQFAYARLHDEVTTLTQVLFNTSGAAITRFGTEKKPKEFFLNTEEVQAFVDTWNDYQAQIIAHKEWKEAQKQGMIAEAKALAKSVKFDLDTLNVRVKCDNERWTVKVPAIGYEMYNINLSELKDCVQEAFKRIEHDVISAETWHWTSNEWPAIIASYRRAFPIEPEEIQQARKLLEEAGKSDLTKIVRSEMSPTNGWDLIEGHEPICTQMHISAVLPETRKYLTSLNAEQGEPEEIQQARKLLKESLHITQWAICSMYPGTTVDCWSFDNGMEGEKHFALLNKPAAELLNLVSAYLIDKQLSAAKEAKMWSDKNIAEFGNLL